MEEKKRDDFSSAVKEILKQRASYICSNPSCKKMTITPSALDENKVQYIGLCAHITAAIKGGPRFDESLTPLERSNIKNAIFLCTNCATQIDKNNGLDYSVNILNQWKDDHEKWVMANLNKNLNDESISIKSINQFGGITANVVNLNAFPIDNSADKRNAIDEHDKKIFVAANEILSEDTLNRVLGIILGDESIKANEIEKIEDLKSFYGKVSNQYVNENIENARKEFHIALDDFNEFLGTEFDMYPYNQKATENYRVCMNPQVNIDRGGYHSTENFREHSRLKNLLYDKTIKLQDTYNSLRREVKISLLL